MAVALVAMATLISLYWLARLIHIGLAVHRSTDTASGLLALACNRLPPARADWGQAMLTELACIQRRSDRWRFAAGAIRAAVSVRAVERLRAEPGLCAVLAGVVVSAGLTVSTLVAAPELRTDPKMPLFLTVLALVLGAYATLALARARDPRHGSRRSRRWSVAGGLVLAVVWFGFAAAWWNLHSAPLFAAVGFAGLIGAAAARSTASTHEGVSAVTWAGLIAGLSVFIASTIDAFATAAGPYSADQIAESAHSGYASSAAYWMGEDLGSSLLLLILVPCVSIGFGAAGAALSAIGQRRRPRTAHLR